MRRMIVIPTTNSLMTVMMKMLKLTSLTEKWIPYEPQPTANQAKQSSTNLLQNSLLVINVIVLEWASFKVCNTKLTSFLKRKRYFNKLIVKLFYKLKFSEVLPSFVGLNTLDSEFSFWFFIAKWFTLSRLCRFTSVLEIVLETVTLRAIQSSLLVDK